MSDQAGVYERLSVREYVEFFAAACEVPFEEVVEAALSLTDLDKLQDKMVSALSKGMKQRLQVARVLVNDPDILLLDEPASDLDPRARIELRDLLGELRSMGKTVVLSSHILSELEEICGSVAIVDRGNLIVAGPIEEIADRLHASRTTNLVRNESVAAEPAPQRLKFRVVGECERARGVLLQSPHVVAVDLHPKGHLMVSYRGDETAAASLARTLVLAGIDLLRMDADRSELENVFLEVTRGDLH